MHELKGTFGRWCAEGTEQYISLSARALKMRLWAKTCALVCYTVVKKISDEILSVQL
jgi:hypothetical protein